MRPQLMQSLRKRSLKHNQHVVHIKLGELVHRLQSEYKALAAAFSLDRFNSTRSCCNSGELDLCPSPYAVGSGHIRPAMLTVMVTMECRPYSC